MKHAQRMVIGKEKSVAAQVLRIARAIWWHTCWRWVTAVRGWYAEYRERHKPGPIRRNVFGGDTFRGKALLTYIAQPFLPGYDTTLAHTHSNHWKTKAIAQCLADQSLSVDVTDWENLHAPPARDYDVVIGHGYGYEASCAKPGNNGRKIFLGATAYMDQIVSAERERLRRLYERKGVRCRRRYFARYTRDRGPAISDALLLLGTDWVISTYPQADNRPTWRWANVVVEGVECTLNRKRFDEAGQHFLWLSGYAAVHRGLDVLLEVFSVRPDLHLWICGAIGTERDFMQAYERELRHCPNIHYHGWIDVTGAQFQELTARCGYAIYPSASDAMAGSLVNLMASGLVPIMTLEAGTDSNNLGMVIPDCQPAAVGEIVDRAAQVAPKCLQDDAEQVESFARARYSKRAFIEAMDVCFRGVLGT